ncbi:endonuclease/exonuclease/phosphatase family protein [Microbacterium yannicii]|uniref:endonuclease/exonuclease/phosphatase family protein n=1 Tax=Microbacterium yannicii TaxID=671622 RepID=UPI0009FDFF99|nr:endonuclease/exonuclease/phosphatase family protein [Microbacterium yannicii]
MERPEILRPPERLRVLTFNVLDRAQAEGDKREVILKDGLARLDADVIALQEVTRSDEVDQARDWFGFEVTIIDHPNAPGESVGACLVSRHPVAATHVLGSPAAARAPGLPWLGAVAAEVLVPPPIGPVLVIHHKPSWQLDREDLRENQAVAVARFADDLTRDRPDLPVILVGDFDAAPDAASMRFLTGKASLGGMAVRYEDCWEALHPREAGHTFSPRNPLVRAGQMPLERGRRIDHIMVRSGDHGPLLDVAECRLVFDEEVDGVWGSDHFGVCADLVPPPHRPRGVGRSVAVMFERPHGVELRPPHRGSVSESMRCLGLRFVRAESLCRIGPQPRCGGLDTAVDVG